MTPGDPMPTPMTGRVAAASSSRHRLSSSVDRGLPRAPLEGDRAAGDDVADERQDRAEQVRVVGEVDGDDLERLGPHPDERGGLADLALDADAELLDQPLGDQRGHQVGHGDAGQARAAGEVGAGRRADVEEVREHQRPVVRAGVLGQHLARRAQGPTDSVCCREGLRGRCHVC